MGIEWEIVALGAGMLAIIAAAVALVIIVSFWREAERLTTRGRAAAEALLSGAEESADGRVIVPAHIWADFSERTWGRWRVPRRNAGKWGGQNRIARYIRDGR
jgi:hypothetical protein